MRKLSMFLLVLVALVAYSAPAFATATTLSVQEFSDSGVATTNNAADTANGNRFLNPDENVFIMFQNTHASSSATVTVTAQTTSKYVPGLGTISRADISVSLAAGDIKIVGPLPRAIFNDASSYVNMTTSGAAASSVKISPFKGKGLARGPS
jgi:hypothetical protein